MIGHHLLQKCSSLPIIHSLSTDYYKLTQIMSGRIQTLKIICGISYSINCEIIITGCLLVFTVCIYYRTSPTF